MSAIFDTLCPMHARLGAHGHIVHAGPTLQRIHPEGDLRGRRFLELFEMRRPVTGQSMEALRAAAGLPLRLRLRQPPGLALKGVLVALGPDSAVGPEGGALVNLSFAIALPDAVRAFDLTRADFAATDLAVEMLYLIEAKTMTMEALHKANLRLQGGKTEAEAKAFTDTLTGLGNRRLLDRVTSRMIAGERDFALMSLDLDFFKAVNDSLGHAAGDHVLRAAAQAMLEETRSDDTVLRFGGDEFMLILAGMTRRAEVDEFARRLIARLEVPIVYEGETCRISASIGAVLSRDSDAPDIDAMMAKADAALYAAKQSGRGRHVLYDPKTPPVMHAKATQRRADTSPAGPPP